MMVPKKQESERKNDLVSTASSPDLRSYLLTALIIIGVVSLGLLAVNQYLDFRYKVVWLSTPCDLCLETNPRLGRCFQEALIVYQDPLGNEISKEEYTTGRNKIYNSINFSLIDPAN